MIDNPYIVGPAVKGQNHHGRVDLLRQVLSGGRDGWCIVGLRRFGKTSFLHQLDHLVQGEGLLYLPVYWSLQGCESQQDLLENLLGYLSGTAALLESIGLKLGDISDHGRNHGLIASLWRLAAGCKRQGRKLLLLCDECELLWKLGLTNRGLLGRLRAVLQATELVRTVLMGSRQLANLHTADMDGSAFLDGFEPVVWLPPFTSAEVKALVQRGNLNPELAKGLYESTEGHPYYVQALCSQFFRGETTLSLAIQGAYRELQLWIETALEQDFSYLAGEEQAILNSLRNAGPATLDVLCGRLGLQRDDAGPLLFALQRSCYIKLGADGQYTLANAFLEKWLLGRTQVPSPKIPPTVDTGVIKRLAEEPETTPASRLTVYDDFVVLISADANRGAAYSVQVLQSAARAAKAPLKLNPRAAWIQGGIQRIEAGYQGTKLFEQLGSALFKAVFHGTVGELYRRSEGRAEEADHGLRLRLCIEPPQLLELPWELLFDPSHKRFLARSQHTPISHSIEPARSLSRVLVRPPLRLLVVVSSPVNLNDLNLRELDVKKEKDQIAQALDDWVEAKLAAIELMDNAIVGEVQDQMRRFQPHVVHFIGHGGLISTNGNAQGFLVMEDEQRKYRLVNEEKFCELVDQRLTRLVVLNACKTAASATLRGPVGVAPRLVRAGIPAVVAMRYPIVNDAAITFSREFYRALSSGLAVDAAVADARKGLFLDEESSQKSDRDWFMPVVFMRAPDGKLFDIVER
jgi:hypothetical protein